MTSACQFSTDSEMQGEHLSVRFGRLSQLASHFVELFSIGLWNEMGTERLAQAGRDSSPHSLRRRWIIRLVLGLVRLSWFTWPWFERPEWGLGWHRGDEEIG